MVVESSGQIVVDNIDTEIGDAADGEINNGSNGQQRLTKSSQLFSPASKYLAAASLLNTLGIIPQAGLKSKFQFRILIHLWMHLLQLNMLNCLQVWYLDFHWHGCLDLVCHLFVMDYLINYPINYDFE
eukprot:NODE_637_length_5155_cov_0.185127.p3 type:complete len:128 gc:universal NODE_637_length_5155_cov_0.185127:225-608(+)